MRVHSDEGKFVHSDKQMGGTAFKMKASASGFKTVIDSLYRFKELAVVRETISNAADSHSERDKLLTPAITQPSHYTSVYVNSGLIVDKVGWLAPIGSPIIIHTPTDTEPYFEVEDNGVGLTLEDVIGKPMAEEVTETHIVNGHEVQVPTGERNYVYGPDGKVLYEGGTYTTIFDSPKETSDDQIGGFGLGCKSPLAVSETFTVTVRKDGDKHIFVMYLNSSGEPYVDLLTADEKGFPAPIKMVAGEEFNGVTVNVPVALDRMQKFRSSIGSVLRFMHGNFEFRGTKLTTRRPKTLMEIGSTHLVKEGSGEHFAVQGGVVYPIDMKELNDNISHFFEYDVSVDTYTFFEIGELSVQPSREDLQYDKRSVTNLNEKLEVTLLEIEERLENQIIPTKFKRRYEIFMEYRKLFGVDFLNKHLPKGIIFNKTYLDPIDLELSKRGVQNVYGAIYAAYRPTIMTVGSLKRVVDYKYDKVSDDPFSLRSSEARDNLKVKSLVDKNGQYGSELYVITNFTDKIPQRLRKLVSELDETEHPGVTMVTLNPSFFMTVRGHLGIPSVYNMIIEELDGVKDHGLRKEFTKLWTRNSNVKRYNEYLNPENTKQISKPGFSDFGKLQEAVTDKLDQEYGFHEFIKEVVEKAFEEIGSSPKWVKDYTPLKLKVQSGAVPGVSHCSLPIFARGFRKGGKVTHESIRKQDAAGRKILYIEANGASVTDGMKHRLNEIGVRFGETFKSVSLSSQDASYLEQFAESRIKKGLVDNVLDARGLSIVLIGKTGMGVLNQYPDVFIPLDSFLRALVDSIQPEEKVEFQDKLILQKAFTNDFSIREVCSKIKGSITLDKNLRKGQEPRFEKYYRTAKLYKDRLTDRDHDNDSWFGITPEFLKERILVSMDLDSKRERHVERIQRFYSDLLQEIDEAHETDFYVAVALARPRSFLQHEQKLDFTIDTLGFNNLGINGGKNLSFLNETLFKQAEMEGDKFFQRYFEHVLEKATRKSLHKKGKSISVAAFGIVRSYLDQLAHYQNIDAVIEYVQNDRKMKECLYTASYFRDMYFESIGMDEAMELIYPDVRRELHHLVDDFFKCREQAVDLQKQLDATKQSQIEEHV